VAVSKPVQVLDLRAVRDALSVSQERMARMLDVSVRTVERWERGGLPLDPAVRERVTKLREIAELGHEVYTPEGWRAFLVTPQPVFVGRTAIQLIGEGHVDQVLGALAADYEGLGF
jgi:transcriptional regulator with XRE-family HTH domain